MRAYVLRRLLFLPFLWLAVTAVIFAMLQPLGPYQRLALFTDVDPENLGGRVGGDELQRIIDRYDLDAPFHVQYGRWLGEVLEGNLGWSRTTRSSVLDAITDRLPATLELALFAVIPVLVLAVWLGVIAATHHNGWLDRLTRGLTTVGASMPSFVVAIVGLMVFYGRLSWFPAGRLSLWAEQAVFADSFLRPTGMVSVDALVNGRLDVLLDALRHLVLPVSTLAFISWADLAQVTRSSMLEAMQQEYMVAARAKGLPERLVVYRHALRNALVPVTTLSVGTVIGLVNGVFVTETVFNFKGLGHLAVTATTNFDVPTVVGVALFNTTLIVIGRLAADLIYAVVDPRIRYG